VLVVRLVLFLAGVRERERGPSGVIYQFSLNNGAIDTANVFITLSLGRTIRFLCRVKQMGQDIPADTEVVEGNGKELYSGDHVPENSIVNSCGYTSVWSKTWNKKSAHCVL